MAPLSRRHFSKRPRPRHDVDRLLQAFRANAGLGTRAGPAGASTSPGGTPATRPLVTLSAWVKPEHDANRVLDLGDDTTRYLCLAVRNVGGVVLGGRDWPASPIRPAPTGPRCSDAVGGVHPSGGEGALVARVGKVVDAWIAGGEARARRRLHGVAYGGAGRPACPEGPVEAPFRGDAAVVHRARWAVTAWRDPMSAEQTPTAPDERR
ncbi:hypothetical protein LT493_01675 [Streptomyces tricolor]|nr:hypothetical protein [Streptomyces tricolor]